MSRPVTLCGMAMERRTYTAGANDDNKRLDRILRVLFPEVPIGAIARIIRTGDIRINGEKARHNSRVHDGDRIDAPARLTDPSTEDRRADRRPRDGGRDRSPDRRPRGRDGDRQRSSGDRQRSSGHRPGGQSGGRSSRFRERTLEFPPVLFRNEHVLVLNKSADLTVQGPRSLTNMVQERAAAEGWTSESLSFRPGPVHRLDRETTGIQIFSLSVEAARQLTEAFRDRKARKIYLAVVSGLMAQRTVNDRPIGYHAGQKRAVAGAGKEARTLFVPLVQAHEPPRTLVAAIPATGRTHQVRVHAADLGFPLVQDTRYGGERWSERNAPETHILHNTLLSFDPALVDVGVVPYWQAPLQPATWHFLTERFGDLAGVRDRLATLAREVSSEALTIPEIRL